MLNQHKEDIEKLTTDLTKLGEDYSTFKFEAS